MFLSVRKRPEFRVQSVSRNGLPSLRRSAGARLTVIRRAGNSKPELRIAERTRSRASRTAVSGNPTTVKARQAIGNMYFDPNFGCIDAQLGSWSVVE